MQPGMSPTAPPPPQTQSKHGEGLALHLATDICEREARAVRDGVQNLGPGSCHLKVFPIRKQFKYTENNVATTQVPTSCSVTPTLDLVKMNTTVQPASLPGSFESPALPQEPATLHGHQFPVAAVTRDLVPSNTDSFSYSSAGQKADTGLTGLRSRCEQAASFWSSRGEPTSLPFPASKGARIPWLMAPPSNHPSLLPPSSRDLPFL